VGIPTGFVVDAADNTTPGWVEHWTENGTNEIKDLTLNVQKCSDASSWAAASVHELQVFAWRIKSQQFAINEGNKTITVESPMTLARLRNGLDVDGNCTVSFVTAEGTPLDWSDTVSDGSKMIVTDIKDHTFTYTITVGEVPEQYTVTVKTQGEGDASAAPTAAAEGDTVTLTAQAAEGWHFVEWTSEDVTVSEEGTFQMPAKNVTVTAVFEQDVTDVKVESITVSAPADAITEAGGTLQMSAAVLPEDATDKSVTWSVTAEDGSDTALASIDGSGLLTAGEAEGVVKVVATANDGSGVTGEKLIT
ncbi:InlB B-repeat-containing protein, partial [Flavonifractor hominis]